MNAKIREIVDALFQDVEMTEEARNLHDELCADLNDRLNDELADGVSEEVALTGIRAGLADFSELIRDFPRRERGAAVTLPDEAPQAVVEERAVAVRQPDAQPMDDVREVVIRLGMDDVSVVPSEDQQLHLALTGDAETHWRSELRNGQLILELDGPEPEQAAREPESFSDSLLRSIVYLSRRVFRDIGRQPCHGEVRIPAGWRGALSVATGSGDIGVDLPLETLTLRSASGDIRARLYEGCRKAALTTASGDVEARGDAAALTVSTTSGDIDVSGGADRLRVTTVSGDTRLLSVRAGSLTYHTTSGDFDMDGEVREMDFKTVSGDVEARLRGAVSRIQGSAVSGDTMIALPAGQCAAAQTHTVSGSVRVERPEGPGAAQIRLNSVSGDIRVV